MKISLDIAFLEPKIKVKDQTIRSISEHKRTMGHIYWRNRILSNLQAFAKIGREKKKEGKNFKSMYKTFEKKTMVELNRKVWIRKLFTRFWVFFTLVSLFT